MIKLRPVKKIEVPVVKEAVVEKRETGSKLPPDVYKNLLDVRELHLSDTTKLVYQVRRGGELGLAEVDIRVHITTPQFTGFTKKGIIVPIEFFDEFSDHCVKLIDEMEDFGLYAEIDEV